MKIQKIFGVFVMSLLMLSLFGATTLMAQNEDKKTETEQSKLCCPDGQKVECTPEQKATCCPDGQKVECTPEQKAACCPGGAKKVQACCP